MTPVRKSKYQLVRFAFIVVNFQSQIHASKSKPNSIFLRTPLTVIYKVCTTKLGIHRGVRKRYLAERDVFEVYIFFRKESKPIIRWLGLFSFAGESTKASEIITIVDSEKPSSIGRLPEQRRRVWVWKLGNVHGAC